MNGLPIGFPFFVSMKGQGSGEPLPDYISDFLNDCQVQEGLSHNNLTLFPITCPQSDELPIILTLEEAVGKGLEISEIGEGDVNKVKLKNNSQHYVLIMAGEILIGCKQDRTLEEDILIAPETEKISVSVFCVEAGRWRRISDEFRPAKEAVTPRVRKTARLLKSQSAVWDEISFVHFALNIEADTDALREVYTAPKTKDKIEDYMKVMGELPKSSPQVSGLAVAIGGEIICLDLFSNKKLFDALYPKLLKSYAVEAMIERKEKDGVSKEKITGFMKSLLNGKANHVERPGAGEHWEIISKNAQGSCLVFQDKVIHLSAFPGEIHRQRR